MRHSCYGLVVGCLPHPLHKIEFHLKKMANPMSGVPASPSLAANLSGGAQTAALSQA